MGNPGKMNRRLTIQQRTFTKDAAGGRVESWADVFSLWAEPVKARTQEAVVTDAEREKDYRRFRVRYREALNAGTFRVLYRLKFYDIEGIEEEVLKDRMVLTCKAIQAT